jgi:hypothetical protein
MAIPSYVYLKLKILGPCGVITVDAKTQRALDCEQNNIELDITVVTMTELREFCLSALPTSIGPGMPSLYATFKAVEDAKAVQIDAEDPAKTIQIGTGLSP